MADLTIAGSLSATGTVEVRPVRANLQDEAGRLVPPVVVPATPAFSVRVPEVPGAVYRIRGYSSAGRPGDQVFTTRSVSGLTLKVPVSAAAPGGGGGPAYDDTALKARVAAVETGKLDKTEAGAKYTPLEASRQLSERIDRVDAKAGSGAEALAKVENLEQEPFLKGLVLGLDDPVPPGTPSGYVIVRKAE